MPLLWFIILYTCGVYYDQTKDASLHLTIMLDAVIYMKFPWVRHSTPFRLSFSDNLLMYLYPWLMMLWPSCSHTQTLILVVQDHKLYSQPKFLVKLEDEYLPSNSRLNVQRCIVSRSVFWQEQVYGCQKCQSIQNHISSFKPDICSFVLLDVSKWMIVLTNVLRAK